MAKRLSFTAHGFVRSKEDDFRDDGTYFTCYRYRGLRISTTSYEGTKFISVRVEYSNHNFIWEDFKDLPEYKLCDEFNGVPEDTVDMDKLVENCNKIADAVEELDAKIANETIDTAPIIENIQKEVDEAKELINNFEENFDLFAYAMSDEFANYPTGAKNILCAIREYVTGIKRDEELIESIINKTIPNTLLRTYNANLGKGYHYQVPTWIKSELLGKLNSYSKLVSPKAD